MLLRSSNAHPENLQVKGTVKCQEKALTMEVQERKDIMSIYWLKVQSYVVAEDSDNGGLGTERRLGLRNSRLTVWSTILNTVAVLQIRDVYPGS